MRAGGIIGVHEVLFGFPYQTVRLKHESIAREAFGSGANFALGELKTKEIGFYSMEDLVGKLFVEANKEYISQKMLLYHQRKNSLKEYGSTSKWLRSDVFLSKFINCKGIEENPRDSTVGSSLCHLRPINRC